MRILSKKDFFSAFLAVFLSVAFVFTMVEAATTINTNINTGGTLAVTGLTTLGQASTTRTSVVDTAYFGGSATSTFNAAGTLTMAANVVSDADSTDSLGLTGTRWASTFSDAYTGNTITLDGTTGVNTFTITNNVADALSVVDSSGDLIVFDTSTGAEKITVSPSLVAATTTVESFTQGGQVRATSTELTSAETLTEDEMLTFSIFEYAGASPAAAMTITLPATSTMTTLLANPGDMRTWLFDNQYTVAATTTTIVAGTGMDLIGVTAADDVIDGGEWAELTCWRQADTDVTCLVSELVDAD